MALTGSHVVGAEGAPADLLFAGAQRAARNARQRLANAVSDLFLPDPRLSDLQRTTMTQLLAKLVAAVEDDLRQRLLGVLEERAPAALLASLAAGRLAIAAPILDMSGLLRDAELIAVLLRRADEHRLVTALHLAAVAESEAEGSAEPPLFDALLSAGDPELARAVMALLIAESRRFDRFQDPLLARTDLPAEVQHMLVWWVAAALRDYMVEQQQLAPAVADRGLVAAAHAALASYDEGETLEARAMALARRLQAAGMLADPLIVRALREGKVALAAAGLAVRAGLDFASAWDMLADGEGSRITLMLRAIGMRREAAAELLMRLSAADPRLEAGLALSARMEAFDATDADAADEAIRTARLDEAYVGAVEALARGLGRR